MTMMRAYYCKVGTPSQSSGAATLVVTGVLLFLITIISVITAQTVVVENQVTNNQQREVQAFNAAQTGLDYFNTVLPLPAGSPLPDLEGNTIALLAANADCNPGIPQFRIESEEVPGLTGFFDVTSTGFSADCIARRVVSQRVVFGNTGQSEPERVPLVAGAGVAGGGNAHNIMNPENNFTIWSGEGHDPAQSNTLISNPADPCDFRDTSIRLASCMPVGNNPSQLVLDNGLSVIANDQSLKSLAENRVDPATGDPDPNGELIAYFQNFMGQEPAAYRNGGLAQRISPDDAEASIGATMVGGRFWVDGPLSINGGTIGCSVAIGEGGGINQECGRAGHAGEERPTLLIVDGDFSTAGNPNIYGVVYVRGNLDVTGTLTVFGSIIVEGQVTGTGNVDLFFSGSTLDNIEQLTLDVPVVVPGTWRDWEDGI